MSTKITALEPKAVWNIFHEMTQIPRPSRHEEQIQEWAETFGRKLGLETLKDSAGNIIIRKPASPGMENRQGVVLQAHLDMVPQKNSDKEHDFTTDPIETIIDKEWVKANQTTLGADNGIGAASILAILADNTLEHGPIEALLTSTEETGMDGANGLEPGILHGDILINTDSEDEGELYVGCAGGEDVNIRFRYREKRTPKGYTGFKISVTGLKGGHSGIDIILGRGNAVKIFFRLLNELNGAQKVRLSSIDGGSLRNAIPREAFGIVAVKKFEVAHFIDHLDEIAGNIRSELSVTEPDLLISVEELPRPDSFIDKDTQFKLTQAIVAMPNGVIRMSDTMPGLVETSSNLAIAKSDADKKEIRLSCLLRSSVDSAKEELGSRIYAVCTLAGAKVKFAASYPGWKPNPDSPILKTMQGVYQQKFGKTPEVKAIHAGLECGILGGKYPNWDMISLGPTIRHPHSPDEKVNIASVQKYWDFLLETLKNIPVKQG